MSEPSSAPPASDAASAGTAKASTGASSAPKKPASQGNPAFRMLGLPRLRLPSRNWLIFLSLTGSIAGAVTYDKWQTRRNREKWCRLVAHLADEPLSTNMMPRKMTVYLAAPPADGLRGAREHFHEYVKPVLVAAAMDWDVVEGRKEGDVRYKTAERIRRRRRRQGEGTPVEEEETDSAAAVEQMRAKTGTTAFDGVAGDLVIGRNTWKEYIRGLHEGWLGPVDTPPHVLADQAAEQEILPSNPPPEQPSLVDAATKTAVNATATLTPTGDLIPADQPTDSEADPTAVTAPINENEASAEKAEKEDEAKKEEKKEEKPKRRNPLPYIEPSEYEQAQMSSTAPDVIGPSIGVRYPHILGFRNTPIRFYRFLTRRYLADDIGRQVASAVLAANKSLDETSVGEDDQPSSELASVLLHEEKNWWKTTYAPRKELEESVWIEPVVAEERITSRMRLFQLTAEDADRAQSLATEPATTNTTSEKGS